MVTCSAPRSTSAGTRVSGDRRQPAAGFADPSIRGLLAPLAGPEGTGRGGRAAVERNRDDRVEGVDEGVLRGLYKYKPAEKSGKTNTMRRPSPPVSMRRRQATAVRTAAAMRSTVASSR